MLRTSPYFYLSLHSCVGLFLYPQFFSSRMRFFFSWSVNSWKIYEIWDFWLIILQLGSFKFYCFTHMQSRILQVRVFVSPSFPFFPLLLVNSLIFFLFFLWETAVHVLRSPWNLYPVVQFVKYRFTEEVCTFSPTIWFFWSLLHMWRI